MNLLPPGGHRALTLVFKIVAVLSVVNSYATASVAGISDKNPHWVNQVTSSPFDLPHGVMLNQVRFLTDGVNTVEIPAGSLLHLPLESRIRIATQPAGEVMDWVEFFRANSDVIRQVGVSRAHLRGEQEIHRSVFDHLLEKRVAGVAIAAGRPTALPRPQ